MFILDCPHHGARTLVTYDAVRTVTNTDAGIVIEVECWCGGLATVVTGRHAVAPGTYVTPAPAALVPLPAPAAPTTDAPAPVTAVPAPSPVPALAGCGVAA